MRLVDFDKVETSRKADFSEKSFTKRNLRRKGQLNLVICATDERVTVTLLGLKSLPSISTSNCSQYAYLKLSLCPDNEDPIRYKTALQKVASSTATFHETYIFDLTNNTDRKRLLISAWSKTDKEDHGLFLGCMSFGLHKTVKFQKVLHGWFYLLRESLGRRQSLKAREARKRYSTESNYHSYRHTNDRTPSRKHHHLSDSSSSSTEDDMTLTISTKTNGKSSSKQNKRQLVIRRRRKMTKRQRFFADSSVPLFQNPNIAFTPANLPLANSPKHESTEKKVLTPSRPKKSSFPSPLSSKSSQNSRSNSASSAICSSVTFEKISTDSGSVFTFSDENSKNTTKNEKTFLSGEAKSTENLLNAMSQKKESDLYVTKKTLSPLKSYNSCSLLVSPTKHSYSPKSPNRSLSNDLLRRKLGENRFRSSIEKIPLTPKPIRRRLLTEDRGYHSAGTCPSPPDRAKRDLKTRKKSNKHHSNKIKEQNSSSQSNNGQTTLLPQITYPETSFDKNSDDKEYKHQKRRNSVKLWLHWPASDRRRSSMHAVPKELFPEIKSPDEQVKGHVKSRRKSGFWKSFIREDSDEKLSDQDFSKEENLKQLLQHKGGISAFRKFLASEYSEENVDFWLECEAFKSAKESKLQKRAQKIYERFLAPAAPNEVNINAKISKEIKSQLQNPTIDIFEGAQTHVYYLMERDSFRRFLTSKFSKS